MFIHETEELINLNRVYPSLNPNHCGYCEQNGSSSWSFTKNKMKAETYNILMERGWRRSGNYFYKPNIAGSCCKMWTHRMDVAQWKVKKDQRKTWRMIGEWIRNMVEGEGNVKDKREKECSSKANNPKPMKGKAEENVKCNEKIENNKTKMIVEIPDRYQKILTQTVHTLESSILQSPHLFQKLFIDNISSPETLLNYKIDEIKLKLLMSQPNAGSDFYTNYLMLLFGINKSRFNKNFGCGEFVKCVKEFIEREGSIGLEEGWELEVEKSGYLLFREKSKFGKKEVKQKEEKCVMKEEKKPHESHMLEEKTLKKELSSSNLLQYQLKISSEQITYGPLRVEVVKADCTKESWQMYTRYNKDIHGKEDKSESSYSNFLCVKALHFGKIETSEICQNKYQSLLGESVQDIEGKRVKLLGCYHMNYYVGKEFIGVGVVDFLPNGLSSVYFFYEPKYKDMRLGVFSSLLEIEYVRWLSLSFPEFKYYYMGFYIQNCTKMNYKGNYEPFELLCPITYQFVEFTPHLKKRIEEIEDKKITSVKLDENGVKIEDMDIKPQDIGPYILSKTKIKHENQILEMKHLNPTIIPKVLGILRTMVEVWGKKTFESFTFVFSD